MTKWDAIKNKLPQATAGVTIKADEEMYQGVADWYKHKYPITEPLEKVFQEYKKAMGIELASGWFVELCDQGYPDCFPTYGIHSLWDIGKLPNATAVFMFTTNPEFEDSHKRLKVAKRSTGGMAPRWSLHKEEDLDAAFAAVPEKAHGGNAA